MRAMAIDWAALRKTLRMRRADIDMSVKTLIANAGIGRTTIYRIESVKEIPHHTMDLETLDRLASAMGWTLADLFAAAEQRSAPPLTQEQREGRQIAALWPLVPENVRTVVRPILQSSVDAAATASQLEPAPAAETVPGSRPVAGQRRKR